MGDVDLQVVLAPGFAEDLADATTEELRARRGQCEVVESSLSFRRRVLHGHMDLLHAEVERRRAPGDTAASTLLDQLSRDSDNAAPRSPSHQRFAAGVIEGAIEGIQDRVRGMSADLPECTDEELQRRAEALIAAEAELSATRRTVLDRLDALQAELASRYRDGRASIDEVLPPATT